MSDLARALVALPGFRWDPATGGVIAGWLPDSSALHRRFDSSVGSVWTVIYDDEYACRSSTRPHPTLGRAAASAHVAIGRVEVSRG